MSGWDAYVVTLKANDVCQDAAILGIEGSVWAADPTGFLGKSTAQEVAVITGKDRNNILINGLTLGQQKMSVIRDEYVDNGTIYARTKSSGGGATFPVTISKTNKTLIVVVGKENVHGGALNAAVHDTVKHLKDAGY